MNADLSRLIAALPHLETTQDEMAAEALFGQHAVVTGRFARLWTLGTVQAQIAAAYAAMWIRNVFSDASERERQLVEVHIAAAMRMFGAMTYLRGAVMKLGQALATYPHLVPEEIAATLARLHFDAPPMHCALVREQLYNELDRDPADVFETFDETACAAASLGQVHRATLRGGERVAVKIQYPGIAQTIDSDLRNLTALLTPLRFTRDWESVSAQLDEVRKVLAAEVDYESEAANIDHARSLFTAEDGVVIPHVFRELSTRRVLTMEYIDGRHLDAWLATNPSQSDRDQFGAKLYTIAFRMYYGGRSAYADPHPGNHLFMDDGRLGLVDFGCVPHYNDAEWALLGEMDATFHQSREAARAVLVRYCDLNPAEAEDEQRLALMDESYRWTVEPLLHRPFDFGDPRHMQGGMDTLARVLAKRYIRSHPLQVYLSRTLLGLRSLLHVMKARVDVRGIRAREIRAAGWKWVEEMLAAGGEL